MLLLVSPCVEIETGTLFLDNERCVGSLGPFESIEEARVSDRPGLGLGTIFPGSWLVLLEADEERELMPEDLVSDRPTRRWLAILFRYMALKSVVAPASSFGAVTSEESATYLVFGLIGL